MKTKKLTDNVYEKKFTEKENRYAVKTHTLKYTSFNKKPLMAYLKLLQETGEESFSVEYHTVITIEYKLQPKQEVK